MKKSLNFPSFTFRIKKDAEKEYLWDEERKMWLVLTPEEWVRQNLIAYIKTLIDSPVNISQEHIIHIAGENQRADIVVFEPSGRALILAECKAPDVKIDQQTLSQAVRYNSVVGADYLLLTNGIKHYILRHKQGQYTHEESFSLFSDL